MVQWSPALTTGLSVSLGLLLFLSLAIFDPSFLSRWLISRARALALSRRLIYSCALEGTIDTPTCWNGVLQSPSVIVSSHLWLFLSFSLISLVPLSLSLARALAHALGLVTSRVLEDTIDTPTGSNGVLPSLCVSLSLSVFFSFCSRAIFDSSLFSRSLSLSLARSRSCSKAGNAALGSTTAPY